MKSFKDSLNRSMGPRGIETPLWLKGYELPAIYIVSIGFVSIFNLPFGFMKKSNK